MNTAAAGNAALFDSLKQLLPDEPGSPSQAEIAAQLGMTENAVRQAFYRFRQRYQSLLREEIAHTVATPGDIEDELRHLIAVIRGVTHGENFTQYKKGECASDSPAMIRVIRICRKCGAKIFSDAPEGLCTGCVLKTALGDVSGRICSRGRLTAGSAWTNPHATMRTAAPDDKKQRALPRCWES